MFYADLPLRLTGAEMSYCGNDLRMGWHLSRIFVFTDFNI